MAYLSETGDWESNIYRIQYYDPILGGEDGIVNIQPRQIANRTGWLLSQYGAEHVIGDEHSITDDMVTDDAAIAESKTALSTTFSEISELLNTLLADMVTFSEGIESISGSDGMKIITIAQALQTLWNTASYPFALEYFDDTMAMRDNTTTYELVDVVSTVDGDDTVIITSTDGIEEGEHFLVTDSDKLNAEIVTVKEILNDTRFLATQPLTTTRESGYVTKCAWDWEDGSPATAGPGEWYITSELYTLEHATNGVFVVRRNAEHGKVSVSVSSPDDSGDLTDWLELDLYSSEAVTGGISVTYDAYDDSYYIPLDVTGQPLVFLVKNETEEDIQIYHMAVATIPPDQTKLVIRQPSVIDPVDSVYADDITFLASKYYNIYRDPFDYTEFRFTETTSGETYTVNIETQVPQYIKINLSEVIPEGTYELVCRHWSDFGDCSIWSEPTYVYVEAAGSFFGYEGSTNSDSLTDAKDEDSDAETLKFLEYEKIRFGFRGTEHTEGFDLAMFATASQLEDDSDDE